jgi:hypothetical protein
MLKSTYEKLFKEDKEPKEGEFRTSDSGVEYLKL